MFANHKYIRLAAQYRYTTISILWTSIFAITFLFNVLATIIRGTGVKYPLPAILVSNWLFWIPLSILVIKFCQQYPLHKNNIPKQIFIHLGVALGVTAIHTLASIILQIELINYFLPTLNAKSIVFSYLLLMLHEQIFIYFLILALYNGWILLKEYVKENKRRASLENDLVKAQNAALQMQIQPHFLFNTHNSIASLVMLGKKEDAVSMLAGLSDLLRKTIELPASDMVPIKKEIELSNLYLEIQKTRFKEKLHIQTDIDPTVYEACIPPFCIQPILENSIKHGLEHSGQNCTISMSIKRKNNHLKIAIHDDSPNKPVGKIKLGIGLSNIKSRLDNLFQQECIMEVKSLEKEGFLVVIIIPYMSYAQ